MACPTTIVQMNRCDKETCATVKGALNAEAARVLSKLADHVRRTKGHRVVIDVSEAEAFDDSGVAALHELEAAAEKGKAQLELRADSGAAAGRVKAAGLGHLLRRAT